MLSLVAIVSCSASSPTPDAVDLGLDVDCTELARELHALPVFDVLPDVVAGCALALTTGFDLAGVDLAIDFLLACLGCLSLLLDSSDSSEVSCSMYIFLAVLLPVLDLAILGSGEVFSVSSG